MARRLGLGMVLAGLLAAPVMAETLDEVEAKLKKAYDGMKSYSGNFNMVMDMSMAGNTMHNEMKGPTEWARRDGKIYMRLEMKGKMSVGTAESKTDTESSMLMVCDGEFMWQMTEQMGMKNAMKMKPDPKMIGDISGMFTELKKDADVKVGEATKIEGAECFVIEAKPKTPSPGAPETQIFYFRKDNGVMVKMVGKDASGKETMTVTLSDFKANPDISADRFKFTPPEGVQVMDMTSMGGGG